MAATRVTVPNQVAVGEIFTVKTLISHVMESGERRDSNGKQIPRMIINKVVCRYNGRVVFEADWHGAIAANPYLAFDLKAKEPGVIEVAWTDDESRTFTERAQLHVG
jgi:sulfur-oxidizing protein SoxZ